MFAPASITTNSFAHAQTLLHRKAALDQILKKFIFHTCGMKDTMSKQTGLTVQWHRYDVPGFNISAKATGTEGTGQTTGLEGHIGSPIGDGSSVVKATLSQYTDYKTFSDISVDTFIDDIVLAGSKNLGYRAGFSVDRIIRNVVDSAAVDETLLGSTFTSRDIAKAVHSMQGADIRPLNDKNFKVVMSPFVSYDLKTDPQAVGFADLLKHTNGAQVNQRDDRGFIGHIHGADVFENTNVFVQGGAYRSYIFGDGGLGIVSLAGRGPSFVSDPRNQRFNIRVIFNDGNQMADPEMVIRAAASYNFLFTAVNLDSSTVRFRKWDATPTIS